MQGRLQRLGAGRAWLLLVHRDRQAVAIACPPESAELWQCPVILSAAKDLLSVCCWYRREDPSPALPAQDDKGGATQDDKGGATQDDKGGAARDDEERRTTQDDKKDGADAG